MLLEPSNTMTTSMYVGQPRRRGMVMGNRGVKDIGHGGNKGRGHRRAHLIQTFIRHFLHIRKVVCQVLGKYKNE